MDDVDSVRQLLHRINNAWLAGPLDAISAALDDCFHEQILTQGPGFQILGQGKAACIQSYVDFVTHAAVLACTLDEPAIHVTGDSAVATCHWTMTYEIKGAQSTESGHDIFVFTRTAAGWRACWRAMLVDPPA